MVLAVLAALAAVLCMWYLVIVNYVLLVIGVIIVIRGLYFYIATSDVSKYSISVLLGVETYYQLVIYTYIVSGCIMIVVSFFGANGAKKEKVSYLVVYCAMTIVLMILNTYGLAVLESSMFSLYSYLNRLSLPGGEFQLQVGIAYPEFAMQISMLIAAFYLIYCIYLTHLANKRQCEAELTAVAVIQASAPAPAPVPSAPEPPFTQLSFEITETTVRFQN